MIKIYTAITLFIILLSFNTYAEGEYILDTYEGSLTAYAVTANIVITKHLLKPTGARHGTIGNQTAWNFLSTDIFHYQITTSVWYRWYLLKNSVQVTKELPNDIKHVFESQKDAVKNYINIFGGNVEAIKRLKSWAMRNNI